MRSYPDPQADGPGPEEFFSAPGKSFDPSVLGNSYPPVGPVGHL